MDRTLNRLARDQLQSASNRPVLHADAASHHSAKNSGPFCYGLEQGIPFREDSRNQTSLRSTARIESASGVVTETRSVLILLQHEHDFI
jgi:hypothetical protein